MPRDYDGKPPYVTCEICHGTGTVVILLEGIEPFRKCKACKGSGKVSRDNDDVAPYVTCGRCSGCGTQPRLGTLRIIDPTPDIFPDAVSISTRLDEAHEGSSKRVFIVHGRNHVVRDKIDLYLTKELGLHTLVMQAGPHAGRTLPEKFEEIAADCGFAVFLLTADDHLQDLKNNVTLKRARQNVILEVGYFWGALGRRKRVAFLVEVDPEMELPTDILGIGWIALTPDLAQTKLQLQGELRDAGMLR